jgi:hypothetical protein
MAWFPGDTMAAFYPARDFAYEGTVYLTVYYNGNELARSSFAIRSLPTLIQGFVADQFMQPLEGLKVMLAEFDRTVETDTNGSYGFGFGEPASRMIPPGRYRVIVNPGLKNRSYGTVEQLIRVVEGQLNTVGIIKVPILNPEEPFRPVSGGAQAIWLAGGDLKLNLTGAQLAFPDGRNSGAVHVQFMNLSEIPYPTLPSAVPHWVFAVQPMGVEVTGTIALEIVMPSLYGGYDYVDLVGDRVVLVGFDPDSYQVVPTGVGLVDKENRRVVAEGPVSMKRLDYIGYALVDEDAQPILKRFADGQIGLVEMIGELETID